MNEDNPILILILLCIVGYVAYSWATDVRKSLSEGVAEPASLPGASMCRASLIYLAIVGSAVLLVLEVVGEIALGIDGAQSKITWLFAVYTLFAAFGEELVFRGFLFYDKGGRSQFVLSCVAISFVFALLHGYILRWEEGALVVDFGVKGIFSTVALFVGSLWFYWLRFNAMNASRSLIPSIVAHLTKNLGVVLVKAIQGHLVGLY